MATWIVLFSLLVPRPAEPTSIGTSEPEAVSLRYRGIDRLLAKFEREWQSGRHG